MTRLADALRRAKGSPALPASSAPEEVDPWLHSPETEEPVLPEVVQAEAQDELTTATPDDSEAPETLAVTEDDGRQWFGKPINTTGSRFADRLREKLVVDPKSRAAAVEQYKRLAAALHHSQCQFGTKSVMVASALGSEGKSLSICNLALTLSHSYRRRVLLIDADLRRPSLHEMFQLPATTGLSEALRGTSDRALPLYEVSPRLMVVPSGRPDPDPIGGLVSERMRQIMAQAMAQFDWVLIDTPPVGIVPDAKVLGALVDAAVLVILAGKSPSALIRQAIDTLGPEKIFGVVLNAAETASTLQNSGYYGAKRE
jgi:capsular exopolysaccharide synthesis family protein